MTLSGVDTASTLADPLFGELLAGQHEILNERTFRRTISIERKRTERSKGPFLLMLLETGNLPGSEKDGRSLGGVVAAMQSCTRETDVIGWYKDCTTFGAMFTGLPGNDRNSILNTILARVSAALQNQLTSDQFNQVSISLHFFPDDWGHDDSGRPSNPALYPDLLSSDQGRRTLLAMKRVMDIAGGAIVLALCSPLYLIIALAVKASSEGPVLFRQKRIGQYGRSFTFLKFRSMHIDNDPSVHRQYVEQLIAGLACQMPSSKDGKGVYKLTDDKRITRLGKFLRQTSLDELPQLLNVLKGDMSLVGPRPPIPYELAAYQIWHRRRLLQVKPGITGLWQVTGRSRVKFDDMVRLDLRYAMSWSPWLDFKILMRTPGAVIKGAH